MERETGFEPATVTLARWGSTGLSYSRSINRSIGRSRFLLFPEQNLPALPEGSADG